MPPLSVYIRISESAIDEPSAPIRIQLRGMVCDQMSSSASIGGLRLKLGAMRPQA